ncbi:MAG: hypothetical protein ACREFQ_19155, partial [Stellaceae bacterium]
MNKQSGMLAAAALAALLALGAPAVAAGGDAANVYAGKEIMLYIGSTPGGGYDSYARLMARHWSAHIPGHPTIVPVNMAGAGSNKLAYYMYTAAPKDGTAVAEIFPGAVMENLIGKPVPDDPRKLLYVGSANNEVFFCFTWGRSPVKTFKDAFTKQAIMAASAGGGSTKD